MLPETDSAGNPPGPVVEQHPIVQDFLRRYDFFDDCRGTIVDGLILKGKPAAFCGPSKSGKSSLAADLVAAGMLGSPFLGMNVDKPFRSAALTFEVTASRFCDMVEAALISRGLHVDDGCGRLYGNDDEWRRPFISSCRELLSDKKKRADFAEFIRLAGIAVVIIDPLYPFLPSASSNLAAVGRRLQSLCRSITAAGAAPVLVHHTRELDVGQEPTIDDMSGAGLSAFVRSWLIVNRSESYRGGGRHRLIGIAGTSEGQYSRLSITIEETKETRDGYTANHLRTSTHPLRSETDKPACADEPITRRTRK